MNLKDDTQIDVHKPLIPEGQNIDSVEQGQPTTPHENIENPDEKISGSGSDSGEPNSEQIVDGGFDELFD